MAKKSMVAVGASIVVVRDGKRITVDPNDPVPFNFSVGEIGRINTLLPGAVRAPINEGGAADDSDDEDEDDSDDDSGVQNAKPKGKAKGKAKAEQKTTDEDDDI